MTPPPSHRAARQMVQTDRYLGMDAVPVGDAKEHSMSDVQSAISDQAGDTSKIEDQVSKNQAPVTERAKALEALEGELTQWVQANWPRDGWNNVVFGEGDPNADLLFIGEGPGADEDAQGRPFVGRAGQLLDKQIAAMKLNRGQVYIANIAKTRPPGNRVPTAEEATLWLPWLARQIELIQPKVIVSLGATSAKYLLGEPKLAITRERGSWREYNGIALMPTFHPAYLLRQYTTENRQRVWSDLKAVMQRLGM